MLVIVKLGGVEVTVAKPQRLFDHARTGASPQLPGAETDERDAGAVRLDEGGRHSLPRARRLAISAISAPLNVKSRMARLAAPFVQVGHFRVNSRRLLDAFAAGDKRICVRSTLYARPPPKH